MFGPFEHTIAIDDIDPEVLTRDIISPVKRSIKGLTHLIKEYEKEQMEEVVYRLIPRDWRPEMKMFTEDEYEDFYRPQGQTKWTFHIFSMKDEKAVEFEDIKLVKSGDRIDVLIEKLEDKEGMVVLSKEKAEFKQNWERILTICNEGGKIAGKVKAVVKGGLLVNIGVEAFLPASQIGVLRAFSERHRDDDCN
jgi:hypothetical protein